MIKPIGSDIMDKINEREKKKKELKDKIEVKKDFYNDIGVKLSYELEYNNTQKYILFSGSIESVDENKYIDKNNIKLELEIRCNEKYDKIIKKDHIIKTKDFTNESKFTIKIDNITFDAIKKINIDILLYN